LKINHLATLLAAGEKIHEMTTLTSLWSVKILPQSPCFSAAKNEKKRQHVGLRMYYNK
jgi:hypothetical protein